MKIQNNKVYPAKRERSGGFSLLEILLIVGIVALVFAFSAPFSLKFYRTQFVEDARDGIIDTLQRAKHYAVLQKGDSSFGVTLSEIHIEIITEFCQLCWDKRRRQKFCTKYANKTLPIYNCRSK